MSDYELFHLIRTFWGTQLRQHLRVQRRTELSQNGKENLWNDLNIEFRPYFRNMHHYFLGTESSPSQEKEDEKTADSLTSPQTDHTQAFVVPRGCKFSESSANDLFDVYVDSFWSRSTGCLFDFKTEEDFATYINEEAVGLRRSFFADAVPKPWWKGLVQVEGSATDEQVFTYKNVSK